MPIALFLSILLVAACGLVYELIAGTVASYLVGDSIFQFSTVIGTYLFAMGIGSFLSRYVRGNLARQFIRIELLIAVVGGLSSSLLFLAFAFTPGFELLLYLVVLVVGTLVGLEIPLLMRLVRHRYRFQDAVAHVLTFDYLGALFASILFPLVLVPKLGLIRSALFFGVVNAVVALWSTRLFAAQLDRPRRLQIACVLTIAGLSAALAGGARINAFAEDNIYADEIIFARDTPYQHIVLTRWKDDLRLFLNSHLQFSSRDEYRYHEALVHPGLAAVAGVRRVLILGGGDGLAVREVLKYPQVERIVLVDLDPAMTRLFSSNRLLTTLNGGSLLSPKVQVVNADAFLWVDSAPDIFDFIVVDFPDPTNYSLGKLYTTVFFSALGHHLSERGSLVVQSTSPMFARQSFWCIDETIRQSGYRTFPYHAYVPSFGEWGFILASRHDYTPPAVLPAGLRFLAAPTLPTLFEFPSDMARVPMPANHLNDQVLVRTLEAEWREISR
ncbi:MAG: polyamine aminopropyltransferase [Acidobacteriota bacterium]